MTVHIYYVHNCLCFIYVASVTRKPLVMMNLHHMTKWSNNIYLQQHTIHVYSFICCWKWYTVYASQWTWLHSVLITNWILKNFAFHQKFVFLPSEKMMMYELVHSLLPMLNLQSAMHQNVGSIDVIIGFSTAPYMGYVEGPF